MTLPPTIARITVHELRKRFNEGKYWERLQSGEYTAKVREDRHPSLTAANEPFCTRSQMVSYMDRNLNEVARVHQYLRTDGTIGASGTPDPKRLLEGEILYRITKTKQSANEAKGHEGET